MRRAPVLTVGLVLLVTGCGASPPAGRTAGQTTSATVAPAAEPTLPAVEGIEGEVVRLRTDEAVGGQVQVRLTSTGDQPFVVSAVALQSPAFTAQPATADEAQYRPGQTIDLPVPVGAVDCTQPVQPVGARVTVTRLGQQQDVVVPLIGDALETVAAEECAVQRVAEVVTVSVQSLTDGPGDVTGDVVLTRVAGGPDVDPDLDVVVVALGRSVLLEPTSAIDLPSTLAAGAEALTLPVRIAPATCEPHVLAEAKKPFVFPLRLRVGDTEAVLDLPLADGQRAALEALVDRVCS